MIAAPVLLALALTGGAAAAAPAQDAERARLVAALRATVALDAPAQAEDPYEAWRGRTPPVPPFGAVCAVRFEPDGVRYRLHGFGSEEEARAAGWSPTHAGACGTCSTLQDLAVYLERPDLTTPVRRCGVRLTASGAIACLEKLGFSPACARTWFFNTRNTRRECLWVCVKSWVKGEPSAGPDGRLNPCLQCDEDRSGPVFKAAAGRTRRNSGLRSSIPRPAEEVAHVVHDYVPGAGAPEGDQNASPTLK